MFRESAYFSWKKYLTFEFFGSSFVFCLLSSKEISTKEQEMKVNEFNKSLTLQKNTKIKTTYKNSYIVGSLKI